MLDDGDLGYSPDPPMRHAVKYRCPDCGALFETVARGQRMNACRNRQCEGTPVRT